MKKTRWHILSQYSDHTLPPESDLRRAIEETSDADVRRDLADLAAIKKALGKMAPLPENPYFWEQFQQRLASRKATPAVLRIPRAFRPAMTVLATVVVVALGAALYLNREDIARYFTRTGEQVASAYENMPLRAWMMPLFAKTSKDEALQFALFGTIPIDEGTNTVLHVDNTVRQGYRIELGSKQDAPTRRVTAEDLYREVRATDAQRRLLDSVLHYAQRQIESSVLLDGERAIAINPSLTSLNTAILTTVATSLEPLQRVRLAKFMEDYETPYTVIADAGTPPAPPEVVLHRLRSIPEPKQYMVFQGSNVWMWDVAVDLDSLREVMEQQAILHHLDAERRNELAVRLERISRTINNRAEGSRAGTRDNRHSAVRVYSDSGMVGIQIRGTGFGENRDLPILSVQPRVWVERTPIPPRPPRNVRVRIIQNADSAARMEVQLDSILKRAFEQIPDMDFDIDVDVNVGVEDDSEPGTPPVIVAPPPPPPAPPAVKKKSSYRYYYREDTPPARRQSDGPMNYRDTPDTGVVRILLRAYTASASQADSLLAPPTPDPPSPVPSRDSSRFRFMPDAPQQNAPPPDTVDL